MAPTYTYLCEACDAIQEAWFSMKEKPDEMECSTCKKMAKSIVSPSNFKVHGYNAANNYSSTSKDRRK